jgi:hypothetical protein
MSMGVTSVTKYYIEFISSPNSCRGETIIRSQPWEMSLQLELAIQTHQIHISGALILCSDLDCNKHISSENNKPFSLS